MQRIKEILDWFLYHNKNLTKEQDYKLDEIRDIIKKRDITASDFTESNFIEDSEKMADFVRLTKEQFLGCYSYLTEQEYDNTKKIYKRLYEYMEPAGQEVK